MVRATRTSEDAIFERRYRRKQARGRGRADGSLVGIRVAEIERVFADRYGDVLPDDDAGRDDLFVMMNHAAYYTDGPARMCAKAAAWAPWLSTDARDDLIADITARPLRWRADSLAKRLGVTEADRARLSLRTIGAIDVTADQRAEHRREQKRLTKQAQRRAAGVPPRPAPTETLAHRKPWRAAGISRSAWFRRRQRDNATLTRAA